MADLGYDLILDVDSGVDRLAFDIRMDFETCRIADASLKHGDPRPKRRLFEIHLGLDLLIVYPLTTVPNRNFLERKYPRIRSISIEFATRDLPEDQGAALDFLVAHLPSGFVSDPAYGLGVTKEMRPLIAAIEELPGVLDIAIHDDVTSRIDGTTFEMARVDYERMRRAFQRIARNYQAESLLDRTILAHNEIAHRLQPEVIPERSRPYRPGTVFKSLGKDTKLGGDDRKRLTETLATNARSIADADPPAFMQLQRNVELVSLDRLIDGFADLLPGSQPESAWQALFELNPFILSMVFGYPVVLIAAGASVGGQTLAGHGTKIADFLVENEGTHNAALVEIKTPQTDLFATEYRSGVWQPSKHVTGAIVQVLDQRTKLTTGLVQLKHHSSLPLLQAYSVECVIVIGMTPDTQPKKASFELIRTQLKDVRLVTFDELLAKLRLLRELLAGSADVQAEAS